MKLIIAGATGYVAQEVLRQSLCIPEITSVIALARKPVTAQPGPGVEKLKSVVVQNYETYPEDVKKEFAGANACIWTVAITPSKSKTYKFEEVRRVCQTSTMEGLKAMYDARPANPFRFLYMSGVTVERDQTKRPAFLADYLLMRGETENQVLAFGAERKGEIEICVAKPGLITGHRNMVQSLWGGALRWTNVVSNISVEQISAAMLDQVVNGCKSETLMNDELRAIAVTTQHQFPRR